MEVIGGFKFYRDVHGVDYLILESSRLKKCLQFVRREGIRGVAVARIHGFRERSLGVLEEIDDLQGVYVQDTWKNWGPLEGLSSLRHALIARGGGDLNLAATPRLQTLSLEWWPGVAGLGALKSLKELDLAYYNPRTSDLTELAGLRALQKLHLDWAKIRSLSGIETLSKLDRLIVGSRGLRDWSAVLKLKNSLQHLAISHAGQLGDLSPLQQLRKLESLALLGCGDLPSLSILDRLRRLKKFAFSGGKIIDGDLTPLLRLRQVAMDNKKHYKPSVREVTHIINTTRRRA